MIESEARQVEAMAAYGIPEDAIAKVLGTTVADLRSRYADQLDTASTKANSRVAENLYRRATGEGRDAVPAGTHGADQAVPTDAGHCGSP